MNRPAMQWKVDLLEKLKDAHKSGTPLPSDEGTIKLAISHLQKRPRDNGDDKYWASCKELLEQLGITYLTSLEDWRLAEECGELIQILSKINRFGLNFVHPADGKTNLEHLIQECADVCVCIEEMGFNAVSFDNAKRRKREKLKEWKNKERSHDQHHPG